MYWTILRTTVCTGYSVLIRFYIQLLSSKRGTTTFSYHAMLRVTPISLLVNPSLLSLSLSLHLWCPSPSSHHHCQTGSAYILATANQTRASLSLSSFDDQPPSFGLRRLDASPWGCSSSNTRQTWDWFWASTAVVPVLLRAHPSLMFPHRHHHLRWGHRRSNELSFLCGIFFRGGGVC